MTPEARLLALLEAVAYERRPCQFCQRPLYFVRVQNGKTIAYTAEGLDHRSDCPRFVQRKPARQDALFPPDGAAALEPTR